MINFKSWAQKPLLIWLIAGILTLRIGLSWLIPPVADESYYMLWAKHLDWAYVDHPGMIAWIISGFNTIIPDTLWAARMASLSCLVITLTFLYKTLRINNTSKQSLQGLLFFILIPYTFVVGMLMQVEQPLLMFGSMAIYTFAKWIHTEKARWVLGLAIALGLGLLSKYTIIVLALGLLAALFFTKKQSLLFKKETLAAIILFTCFSLPIIFWNQSHHWVSFVFHVQRVGDTKWFEHTLDFVGDQLLYLSPVALWFIWKARSIKSENTKEPWGFLAAFIFFFFGIISIKTKVYAHWPALGLLPLTLWFTTKFPETMSKINRAMAIFIAILCTALIFISPGIGLKQTQVRENRQIKAQLSTLKLSSPPILYGDSHGAIGILSYYAQQPVYFPQDDWVNPTLWGAKQFSLWPQPTRKKGDNIIFFTRLSPERQDKLESRFEKVSVLPWHLTLLEGHISEKVFVLCQDEHDTSRSRNSGGAGPAK